MMNIAQTMSRDTRPTAFDAFGEPMASQRPLADAQAERRGFGETKRAAVLFWALAALFLAGRVYWADPPSDAGPSSVAAAQVTVIR